MPNKQKYYLSTREAAKILHVAVSTIQLWTDNGILSAWTTAGGHRRITRSSVEQYLSQTKMASNNNVYAQSLSVVVVANNENVKSTYEEYFKKWNIYTELCISKNGYAGLMDIGKKSPNVIIVDLMISNIDEFEMIKAIKEYSELKSSLIIVVSGLDEYEVKTQGNLPSDVIVFNKSNLFIELEMLIRNKAEENVA